MINGKISKYSQSDVLRDRMQQAGFTHGQEARVTLRDIQIEPTKASEGKIYFCKMGDIEVTEVLAEGDGGPLPSSTTVENLVFPEKGRHDLSNVILSSNGSLRITADPASEVRRKSWFDSVVSFFMG